MLLSLKARQTSDGEGKVSYVYDPTGATYCSNRRSLLALDNQLMLTTIHLILIGKFFSNSATAKPIRSHILHLDLLIRIHLKVLSCIQRTLLVFLVVSRVRTDEVYLAKIDDLSTTFNELRVYGSLPIDLAQFEFQEDYNELVAEITLDLHYLKPTMLVAEYTPQMTRYLVFLYTSKILMIQHR